jgi:hypothetical protein
MKISIWGTLNYPAVLIHFLTMNLWLLSQQSLLNCNVISYKEDGHCRGDAPFQPPNPVRLRWDISNQCEEVIEKSLATARQLIEDVDLHVMMFDAYGKGFIKKCKVSPDAFIQMALQIAYYRVSFTAYLFII